MFACDFYALCCLLIYLQNFLSIPYLFYHETEILPQLVFIISTVQFTGGCS